LEALPQPVLQRVQADEHGIAGEQEMLVTPIFRSLPGELHRIHQNEPTGAVVMNAK
jgi:hypothetical protein